MTSDSTALTPQRGVPTVPAAFTVDPTCAIAYGPGCLARLPELVAATGRQRAFVITDPGLRAAGVADRVLKVLDRAGIEYGVFEGVAANPSTANVDEGAAVARAFGEAAVVALGGGSSLDAAKGISLLAGNPAARAADADALWDAADGMPLIAIPTTSGTGAETNGFGVIEDTVARRKVYLGHPSVRPRAALLDPELTLGLPPGATASTGIDALVHGVESLASRGANAVSVAFATQAVSLVGRWLPVAYRDGADLQARSHLMLGAHLAGQALTISGLGLVHGIGHALTAHTGTPHGIALAAVFEEVMAFSAVEAHAAYEQAARALHVEPAATTAGSGPRDWATAAIGAVREVSGAVEVKRPLTALGVTREMIPAIAAGALADAVTGNAPRQPSAADVADILESVL
ncbi:iron-containing alcohol dehydrogenase family protein [Streptomyces sp. TS71-3]|uniref:iron-containing alcohol dehydrogenase family protein n=1 Tax=Streptomyces sp. TS71-3 TaxID=2733862 RepID=UPI001B171273|nr:iron-containing alcohol dehydrogenase [Streptomyces sp. TS71-3]GHJ37127.1 methanol dehydrogenase [Streptomyces sp. TS71-3]